MFKKPYDKQDYLLLFLICGGLGLAAKFIRNISHIETGLIRILLGSAPSFFAIIGIAFLSLAYIKDKQQKALLFSLLGSLAYEFEQIWSSRVFDVYDIIALLLGYFFALAVYNYGKPGPRNELAAEATPYLEAKKK